MTTKTTSLRHVPNAARFLHHSQSKTVRAFVLELLPHTRPLLCIHSCTAGLLADQIAEKLGEFECPYGCGAKHSYPGWPAHTLVCPNTPITCPFWHTADKFNSRTCNFIGSLSELSTHVKAHRDVVDFADGMETTMNIGAFMQAVSDASGVPEDHPYHHDIVHNGIHNQRAHSLTPIPSNMRIPHINGEPQTWRVCDVYGMTYGYKMHIGGLLITFFTAAKNGGNVCLHYTACSLTTETLTFDIIMSSEKKLRVDNSTVIKSVFKVSSRMVSRPPFAPPTHGPCPRLRRWTIQAAPIPSEQITLRMSNELIVRSMYPTVFCTPAAVYSRYRCEFRDVLVRSEYRSTVAVQLTGSRARVSMRSRV